MGRGSIRVVHRTYITRIRPHSVYIYICPHLYSVWKSCVGGLKGLSLQRVSGEVSLNGVLDGVGALKHLSALLLSSGSLAGVHVLVEDLPEVIGHVEDLEVLGEPKTKTNICFSNLYISLRVKKIILKVWKIEGFLLKVAKKFNYWRYKKTSYSNPVFMFLATAPNCSFSCMTSQISFFWHSRSL